ncbi:hypothetical protein [Teredinibacter sp. KSP-S5-2]|uniref:hypothetical protein n=1 Tax=Teredinibacter sp. KSP-S5-2 TaxID=3034506 RepID=UPI0029348EFA|nr:hypothetical protein [Teredinibacter sp. KSP-S5-2]WNO09142.1 hypothetical protein P5V12_19560 [Teredinibacter sp. KSP-S5-2]
MSENRDYLEMSFHSINCFADGELCVDELNQIVDIALKDGVVDENEKRILRNIIGRLNEDELQGDLLDRVNQLRTDLKL